MTSTVVPSVSAAALNDMTARWANCTILIVARNSGQQGTKAREEAAAEAHEAVNTVYENTGIDVRHRIPSIPALIAMLKSKIAQRKPSFDAKTGKKFVNEYLILDLTPQVRLLVSTGSGKKLDLDLAQPFLDRLNEELKTMRPGLLAYQRNDRVFRTELLGANTLHICKELDITILDGEEGFLRGDFTSIMALLKAKGSSDEASRIPGKTRKGQARRTGRDMAAARNSDEPLGKYDWCSVPYGISQSPPAGMMVVRMKASNGQRGEARLFFDSPDCYPDEKDVAYGLSEVREHVALAVDSDMTAADIERLRNSAARANQIANVRFALAMLGRPGWTINAVGRELARRSFSTHRLRMENGLSASFDDEEFVGEEHRILRGILSRLEFYKTGRLEIRFGIDGVEDIAIENCFPPDGPWATDEDFARIQKYLKITRGGGPATQGLTGVALMTPSGPLPLRSASKERRFAGLSYVVRPADAGLKSTISLPPIPHDVLAESIVAALKKHAEELLTPLVHVDLPQDDGLRNELRAAEKKFEQVKEDCDRLLARITETDEAGVPYLSGPALRELSGRYAAAEANLLLPAQDKVKELQVKLDEATQRALKSNTPAHSDLLLRMVKSLRTATDTTFNEVWKTAVRIDSITRTPVVEHGTKGTVVRWKGTIRTSGAGQDFEAPFSGEFKEGALTDLPAKVDNALKQLLQGVPFDEIDQTNARAVRPALAARLGFDSKFFGLTTCPDRRLVKIAAHLAVDPNRDPAAAAETLGEPLDLVEAVLVQLNAGRQTWHALIAAEETARAA